MTKLYLPENAASTLQDNTRHAPVPFRAAKSFIYFLCCFAFFLPLAKVNAQSSQNFTTVGTTSFAIPAGVNCVKVEAWGGGGGGSTITTNTPTRGGGGSGSVYSSSVVSVASGSYNVVVGNGGAASTNGG